MKFQDLGSENLRNIWIILGAAQSWMCFAQWTWRKYTVLLFSMLFCVEPLAFSISWTTVKQLQGWGQLCLLWPQFVYIEAINVASLQKKTEHIIHTYMNNSVFAGKHVEMKNERLVCLHMIYLVGHKREH